MYGMCRCEIAPIKHQQEVNGKDAIKFNKRDLSTDLGSSEQAQRDGNTGPQVWSVLWPNISQHC